MEITLTSEDIKLIEKLIEIKNRGMMTDSKTVITMYDKIMAPKKARPTTCGSCLRGYLTEMERKLADVKKMLEVNDEPTQEEAPVEEAPKQVEDKPKTKGVAKKKK